MALMSRSGAIITFTSDFGTTDHYVAVMKAAALAHCSGATLIDVTHAIAPADILAGAFVLERAVVALMPATVHVAVVDPGVGTDRRLLVVQVNNQLIVCPDNGLITWVWRRYRCTARVLSWRPPQYSNTFHGRDIMAPVAGMLAGGQPWEQLTSGPIEPRLLDIDLVNPAQTREGQVIHIDHFGNCTTNILADSLSGQLVAVKDQLVGPVRRTYADVEIGEALALVGSSNLLEIAVRGGSAANALGIGIGDRVRLG